MPFAYSNDIDIYYETYGAGEPLILVPGLGSVAVSWFRQIPFLEKHFRVIAIDNRGCGKSSMPEEKYTMRDMAEDLLSLMDCLDIQKASFLGRSMGGVILQELACNYPERVQRLVLANTTAKPSPLAKFVFRKWALMAEEQISIKLFRSSILAWVYSDETIARIREEELSEPLDAPMRTFQVQCEAYARHNALNNLQNIDAPTLIIAGDKDILTPVDDARLLTKNIANSKLAVIRGSAHSSYEEKPDKFNEAVGAFLQA